MEQGIVGRIKFELPEKSHELEFYTFQKKNLFHDQDK